MKKVLCFILAVLMIVTMFAGCERKPEPLRICIDLGLSYNSAKYAYQEAAMEDITYFMRHAYDLTEEDFSFEYVPSEGADRQNTLNRIRTEIMSGEGPDVFIVGCPGGSSLVHEEPLFNVPEKALEMDLFLPLDEYIENAQYAEWDKFTSAVMDGGRNDEGQQIIPLAYKLPTAIYRAEDITHTPSKMIWDEMINDAELKDIAARLGDGYTSRGGSDHHLDHVFGKLADYEEEELAFTEEELLRYAESLLSLNQYSASHDLISAPYCSEGSIGPGFNTTGGTETFDQSGQPVAGGVSLAGGMLNGLNEHDTLTLVPIYSIHGGCTAMVTSFAAVNRNTKRPQEAFSVIDMLLSTDRLRSSDLFAEVIYDNFIEAGMPIHEGIMSKELPVNYNTKPTYSLSDENFAAVCAVRDQITNVQFAGALNTALEKMMDECVLAKTFGEDHTAIVHDAYTTMRQIMAE